MDAPVTFNMLAFVKRLEASGMEARRAEALNDVVFETIATRGDVRAVRGDIKELEPRIGGDLKALQFKGAADLKTLEFKIAETESRLMVRVGAMLAASTALVVAILGALISFR